MSTLRVAVVGVGHLGSSHARILAGMPGVKLVGVADANRDQCHKVAAQCGVEAVADYHTLVDRVDAVSVAVPTVAHFEVASAFLRAGKSVLVEKPLTAEVWQADQLVRLARQTRALLQVGHIERFNPVLAALPHHGEPPRLIEARRVGPYSFRSLDIGAVFDLMIHDLDMVLHLVGQPPEQVAASAWRVFGGREDLVTARLTFRCGTVAQLTASRAGVAPERAMHVWWDDCYVGLDFANRRSVTSLATGEFGRNRQAFAAPQPQEIAALRAALHQRYFQVSQKDWTGGPDQLTLELEQFISCVRTGSKPLVDGDRGLAAVALAAAVLEAAEREPHPVVLALPSSVADAA